MAEGFAKFYFGDKFEIYSAGIEKHGMNLRAIKEMCIRDRCLLELISIPLPSFGGSIKFQMFFKHMGVWGAFPLGVLFALSFCPVSAALFFGSLIPLATKFSSTLLFSSMYGIGTGPVSYTHLNFVFFYL